MYRLFDSCFDAENEKNKKVPLTNSTRKQWISWGWLSQQELLISERRKKRKKKERKKRQKNQLNSGILLHRRFMLKPLSWEAIWFYSLLTCCPSHPPLFFNSSPDSDSCPISKYWISVKEFWPFDLDDLVDPPSVDPFFRRELLGIAGWSGARESDPRFDFSRRREWRELPDESRAGELVPASAVERRRLECFEASEPRLVGELTSEPKLLEWWRLDLGISFWVEESWMP